MTRGAVAAWWCSTRRSSQTHITHALGTHALHMTETASVVGGAARRGHVTPSQWFSPRCDTLIGHSKTQCIYIYIYTPI